MNDSLEIAQRALAGAEVGLVAYSERVFPGERFLILSVSRDDLTTATEIVADVDFGTDDSGNSVFATVRAASDDEVAQRDDSAVSGVNDGRVDELVRLIARTSRSSLATPSLEYIQDGQTNLNRVTAERHNLVFGRRGAGKTALLVEAHRQVESEGSITVWMNAQTYRLMTRQELLLGVAAKLAERLEVALTEAGVGRSSNLYRQLSDIAGIDRPPTDVEGHLRRLPVAIQEAVTKVSQLTGRKVYFFLDDLYLLPLQEQPDILDFLHACVRDTSAWLKIATVKHLSRWWDSARQTGLEIVNDVESVELDFTLSDPQRATHFLTELVGSYARRAGIASLNRVFHRRALDRLVLASGAVPRDYLQLAARAIDLARRRENARVVGIEDVNQAAGQASSDKRRELEEDLAADVGSSGITLSALKAVSEFCLGRSGHEPWTYFKVEFRDKESRQHEYSLLTRLLEVRMVHLLDHSVSGSEAGKRYEVYMLDLSEYSGYRLRRGVHVLNFENGSLTAQMTGDPSTRRKGEAARDTIGIFRKAPTLPLEVLSADA